MIDILSSEVNPDPKMKMIVKCDFIPEAKPCEASQFSLPHTKSPLQLLSPWHPPSPSEHGFPSVQQSAAASAPQQALASSHEADSKLLKVEKLWFNKWSYCLC